MNPKDYPNPNIFPGHGIVRGMRETLKEMLFKRAITIEYPKVKRDDIAKRFRGALALAGYLKKTDNKLVIEAKGMPPCMSTCPANVNVRGYISLIALGKFREAYNLHLESNPLPSICGRICPHPCEAACARGEFKDSPVSIMALKRFMADKEFELADRNGPSKAFEKPKNKRPESVAIIGAGPAGLSCAYYLGRWGYNVTILEKLDVAGGMVRVGIPDYRLPPSIIEKEVERIQSLGVDIRYGVSLGDDITIDELFKQGFGAIFIGVGAHYPVRLGIRGEESEGVLAGEKFLENINMGHQVTIGKKVIIIGGGNTAIDCARTALRKGSEVTIMYRRTINEMPASSFEVEDAMEEGVNFDFLAAPTEVISDDHNKVKAIKCVKMRLGKPDDSGRRRPEPIEGSEHEIIVDTIISAISRKPYLECERSATNWAVDAGLEVSRRCSIEIDNKFATSKKGVFAAGDVATGPGIAIKAIAGGRKAAVSIHNYLATQKMDGVKRTREIPLKTLYNEGPREHMDKLTVKNRANNFEEVEKGFSENQATKEAKRCLSCMTKICIGCSICVDICPANAIELKTSQDEKGREVTKYEIDFGKCIFCGFCSEACPTKAIHHTIEYELSRYNVDDFKYDLLKLKAMHEKEAAGLLNNAKYRF